MSKTRREAGQTRLLVWPGFGESVPVPAGTGNSIPGGPGTRIAKIHAGFVVLFPLFPVFPVFLQPDPKCNGRNA